MTLSIAKEAALTGKTEPEVQAARTAHAAAERWEAQQLAALASTHDGNAPGYGSPEWLRLGAKDPQRAEALLRAASDWRKAKAGLPEQIVRDTEQDIAVGETLRVALYAEWDAADEAEWKILVSDVRSWANKPTAVERSTERQARQAAHAHTVRASAGWPPIAIPGRPGWRRHLVDGRQVDVPADEPMAGAA
ncbi:hypothetical protein BX265_2346 [Streptomyces sp. TLI_235]|nr:hypothetical protein [Streptomyces sp. TLI_235]PBC77595.1 hypothetical protein BX265_2346 [Streptomyces sp. TLI_235]